MIKNNNNMLLYLRTKISSLFALSAITLLLLASPLLLFSLLIQQVHAQTNLSFRTPTPVSSTRLCEEDYSSAVAFDAHGTGASDDGSQSANVTDGTYQITSSSDDGEILVSGHIEGGTFTNNSRGGDINMITSVDNVNSTSTSICVSKSDLLRISTGCSTSDTSDIDVAIVGKVDLGNFYGAVECSSSSQGGGDTIQSSSMTGTTTQDVDGDGILDANDKCPNLPHTRCYKGGDSALVVHNSNR
jgi:hypothetical protein